MKLIRNRFFDWLALFAIALGSIILINKANYADKIKGEKVLRYQYYRNIFIIDELYNIADKCGPGYAVGWWTIDENYLTYKNEELFGYKAGNLYHKTDDNEKQVFSIKRTSGLRFYTEPHELNIDMFKFLKETAKPKNPDIFSCRNVKKCQETNKPIFLEMLMGSLRNYQSEEFVYKSIEDLRNQFENTNHPIQDFTYFFLKDKVDGVYHLFHISRVKIKKDIADKGNCRVIDGGSVRTLKQLAEGIH